MANLSDFTYFANRSLGGVDDPNSDRAQQALAAVRQYDQNAQYRPTYGSDNQLLGYTLDFDASKLPGTNGQGSLGPTSGHGSGGDYMPRFSTVQPGMLLDNPAAVTNSPVYGNITDNTNINPRDDKLMQFLGPLAVAGFAFGIPYLASAMSNGAIGAGAVAGGAADATGAAGASGASGSSGELAGGLGGGAADELTATSSGIGAAGAPASQFSIDVSNWLAAHGLPTELGLSEGALGAAASESGGLLGTAGRLLGNISKIPGLGGASGGSGGGGVGLLGGGTYNAQPYNSLVGLLRRYYGTPNG